MSGIDVEELSDAIMECLTDYQENIDEVVETSVDRAADDCMKEIKAHVTFNNRTEKYVKAFRLKKTFSGKHNMRKTWHVANGEHRKTHLLENGHAKPNGGRTRAFPHIKYGEEIAQQNLPKYIEEGIAQ